MIMLELHQAKALNLGNPQINFIHHWGSVTRVPSHHFQALPSSTTLPYSTSHQACNQALVQPKDIRVVGHCGIDVTSPKEVMVDLKCSLLTKSQGRGHHLLAHLECLRNRLETIQSFSRYLPPLVHTDNFPAHLGDPPISSQFDDISRLRNCAGQRLEGLLIYSKYQGMLRTNSIWSWERLFVGLGRGGRQCPN